MFRNYIGGFSVGIGGEAEHGYVARLTRVCFEIEGIKPSIEPTKSENPFCIFTFCCPTPGAWCDIGDTYKVYRKDMNVSGGIFKNEALKSGSMNPGGGIGGGMMPAGDELVEI